MDRDGEDSSAYRGVRLGRKALTSANSQLSLPINFSSVTRGRVLRRRTDFSKAMRRAFLPSSISAVKESRQITHPIQTGVDEREAVRQLMGTLRMHRRMTRRVARTGLAHADKGR